jgi:hypothetical protein
MASLRICEYTYEGKPSVRTVQSIYDKIVMEGPIIMEHVLGKP